MKPIKQLCLKILTEDKFCLLRKATLQVTNVMEARTQGNSRAINHCYSITAGVDVLRDKTKLGSCLHGLEIRTITDDISKLTDD